MSQSFRMVLIQKRERDQCDFYTCDDHLESAACHPQMPRSSRPTDFLSRVWREVDLSHCGAKRIAPR